MITQGHEDEVWCSAISPDNEFIVTGSKDKTIRLWRLATGGLVCTFNTMVDIFQVCAWLRVYRGVARV